MNKGLLITLLAATASVSGLQAVQANAPTINPLPDIRIGDAENNGTSDNNYFVYTNAFRLDDKAFDAPGETPTGSLLWSFAEGRYAEGAMEDSNTQWFQINGKNPVSVGEGNLTAGQTAAQRPDLIPNGSPTPNSGGTKNLRETSDYATFRDIVLSPGFGTLTAPFPTQAGVAQDHARGKFVTFFVSDGTNVSNRTIVVRSVDNVGDAATQPAGFVKLRDNKFDSGKDGWHTFAGGAGADYHAASGSLRAFMQTGASVRIIGHRESEFILNAFDPATYPTANELRYSEVGPNNWIKAKFHLFAQDVNGGSNIADTNRIPSFRLRITGALYSFASILDLQHHNSTGDATGDALARDLAPTTSSANARVYDVHMDPPEYVQYTDYGTSLGYARLFEAYGQANEPQEQGYLALAESSIGIYPAPAAGQITTMKTYGAPEFTAAQGFGAGQPFTDGLILDITNFNVLKRKQNGAAVGSTPLATEITFSGSAAGFTIDTVPVDNLGAGRYAVAQVDWLAGTVGDTNVTQARTEPGQIYRARFTATATVARTQQSMIRFRVSTIQFQYNPRLEVGGSVGGSVVSHGYLPGTGNASDIFGGAARPGYTGSYDLIFMSPFDINPTETTKTSAGHLGSQGGPGQNTAGYHRELHPGVDVLDELVAANQTQLSKGNVTITGITLQKFPKTLAD